MAVTKTQALNDGVLGGCPLIEDREKLNFDNMIGEIITVENFAKVQTKKDEAYAITFVEYPTSYAWAGGCLKKFIETYGEDFKGTRLVVGEKVKTSNNNDYRTFDVAD